MMVPQSRMSRLYSKLLAPYTRPLHSGFGHSNSLMVASTAKFFCMSGTTSQRGAAHANTLSMTRVSPTQPQQLDATTSVLPMSFARSGPHAPRRRDGLTSLCRGQPAASDGIHGNWTLAVSFSEDLPRSSILRPCILPESTCCSIKALGRTRTVTASPSLKQDPTVACMGRTFLTESNSQEVAWKAQAYRAKSLPSVPSCSKLIRCTDGTSWRKTS